VCSRKVEIKAAAIRNIDEDRLEAAPVGRGLSPNKGAGQSILARRSD